jgi:hypothetical protein
MNFQQQQPGGYGDQGGYGAPQQGYGAPQAGYGVPQQGYGGGYGGGAPPQQQQDQGGYGQPQPQQQQQNQQQGQHNAGQAAFGALAGATGVSPHMMGLAAQAGKGTLDSMVTRVTPGMSQFYASLRLHFAVSNSYVFRKIALVLYPFKNKQWARLNADDGNNGAFYKKALPKDDVNAPDLYLPFMAFITYVLLFAYLQGTENQFTPEDITNAVWRCLLLHLVEASVIKLGINMIATSTVATFMDVVCYTGYKYVGLCGTVFGGFLGGWLLTLNTVFTFYQVSVATSRPPPPSFPSASLPSNSLSLHPLFLSTLPSFSGRRTLLLPRQNFLCCRAQG